MHCNFLINTGEATAADIEGLGEEVRRRVQGHQWCRIALGDQEDRQGKRELNQKLHASLIHCMNVGQLEI